MKVFVYGTLKEGYGNHYILEDAEFVGYDCVQGYRLYNSGFPVAAVSGTYETVISGEIYDIQDNEGILQNLDWLEGVSHGMYERVEVETETGRYVSMYVGPDKYWGFKDMELCPFEQTHEDRHVYTWSRW